MTITGSTATPSTADLWFPSPSSDAPTITGQGISDIETRAVPGGWRLFIRVAGDYRISVS